MNEELKLELLDLGDAKEETKQCTPLPLLSDSWFQWGSVEYQGGGPPHCP